MQYLVQSQVCTIPLGPFVDPTTGAPVTNLTISNTDIRIWKMNAAAWVNATNGAVHSENGYYTFSFSVTDTDTPGRLLLAVQETGALWVRHEFQVINILNYNALWGGNPAFDNQSRMKLGQMMDTVLTTMAGSNFVGLYDNGAQASSKIQDDVGETNPQTVADGMRLLPTGAVNTDSVDDKLDSILTLINESTSIEEGRASDVVTAGTPTGTSANTLAQDGLEWVLTSVAGGIDAELVFNIGTSNENPGTTRIWGRWEPGGGQTGQRIMQLQAFNFTQNAWENLGEVLYRNTSNYEILRGLGRSYVRRGQAGTPGIDGDVRVRFLYDSTVSNKVQAGDVLHLDKVTVFYNKETITLGEIFSGLLEATPSRNYPDSSIHIDTESGQPGAVFGFNGTPGNPVSSLADAATLADTSGFSSYTFHGSSVIALDQAYPSWTFRGAGHQVQINMNGQDVDNSVFSGLGVTGIGLAATNGIRALDCELDSVTCNGEFDFCRLASAPAVTLDGNGFFVDCSSIVPGSSNPSIACGGVGNQKVSITKYGGGIDIGGLSGTANLTVSGTGSVALTDAATTATAIISGNMRRIGAAPTGIILTEEARVTNLTIKSEADTALTDLNLQYLFNTAYDATSPPGDAGSLLNEILQDDGTGNTQFTIVALENAPSGGAGTSDWTPAERNQIRQALGVTGTQAPTVGGDLNGTPAAVWAVGVRTVTGGTIDVCTTNTDMRGTDGASTHTAAEVWTVTTRTVTGGAIDTCAANADMRGTDGASTHTAADVWTVAGRTVTGGTIDVCTSNTDMRGTDGASTHTAADVWAVGVRTVTGGTIDVVGVCASNSDMRGTDGALTDKAGFSLAASGLDLILIDGFTMPDSLKFIAANAAGDLSGAGSGTETLLGLDGTTTRLVATVLAGGNRSFQYFP